jgi:hypothetical protein
MLAGGVHEGKARQEGLQVEPHVTLGGRFAPAVLGPIHTPGCSASVENAGFGIELTH